MSRRVVGGQGMGLIKLQLYLFRPSQVTSFCDAVRHAQNLLTSGYQLHLDPALLLRKPQDDVGW